MPAGTVTFDPPADKNATNFFPLLFLIFLQVEIGGYIWNTYIMLRALFLGETEAWIQRYSGSGR